MAPGDLMPLALPKDLTAESEDEKTTNDAGALTKWNA